MRNRAQAIKAGEKLYFSTNPCLNGHTGPRYVASRNCVECANALRGHFPSQNFRGPEIHLEILRQIWRGLGYKIEAPNSPGEPAASAPAFQLPDWLARDRAQNARAQAELDAMRERHRHQDDAHKRLSESIAGIHAKLAAEAQGGDGSAPPEEFGPAWCK